MQAIVYLTILLVASAAATPSQQQPAEHSSAASSNSEFYHHHQTPDSHPSHPHSNHAELVSGQSSPVVIGNSPANVVGSQSVGVPSTVVVESHQASVVGDQQHHPVSSYYAPSGLITVVGSDQQQQANVKPVVGGQSGPISVRNSFAAEQYGQPESASIPPNYKPFGSWGLYIGGNPADGYYTNYYKALGGGVDKQQQQVGMEQQVKPVGGQTAALSPALRQASGVSTPYVGGDYYPFAYYSPSDLSSAARVEHGSPVVSHHNGPISPVQAGAQVYGSPSISSFGASPYADLYSTKRVGAAYAQKEAQQQQVAPPKGYQSRVYVYPPMGVASSPSMIGQMSASAVSVPMVNGAGQTNHPADVVAYPVPVGSQIVGSQPGVDGAFNPYGIHAFTRYAVKPTVVANSDPSHYYGVQGQAQPSAYKQQQQQVVYSSPPTAGYYPMSYYGYPINQLHYSQGSPSIQGSEQHHTVVGHSAAQPVQNGEQVVSIEKLENEDKSLNKQQ